MLRGWLTGILRENKKNRFLWRLLLLFGKFSALVMTLFLRKIKYFFYRSYFQRSILVAVVGSVAA